MIEDKYEILDRLYSGEVIFAHLAELGTLPLHNRSHDGYYFSFNQFPNETYQLDYYFFHFLAELKVVELDCVTNRRFYKLSEKIYGHMGEYFSLHQDERNFYYKFSCQACSKIGNMLDRKYKIKKILNSEFF